MVVYILAALAIVVVGTCLYLIGSSIAENAKKKPNPEIKRMMKAFNVVSVDGCCAHVNRFIFIKANGFIQYTELEGQDRVFMRDTGNYVIFFYYKKDWLFSIELPKRV